MRPYSQIVRVAVLGSCLAFMAAGVLAEKPDWAGGGKHKEDKAQRAKAHEDGAHRSGFSSDERRLVLDYYGVEAGKGKCPPGLAKKRNGCQPPGQAKQWQKGMPLALDVRYYDLPRELRVRLPPPPHNHRYVQIAGDVLMIAVGTNMVVDAIEDILR